MGRVRLRDVLELAAAGAQVTQQNVKSSLALAWRARLSRGLQTIHGFAHSPNAEITRVEWSANRGESWCDAKLIEPIQRYGWVRFELEWDAPRGKQTLMTPEGGERGIDQRLHPL